jgi:hypothetical protein
LQTPALIWVFQIAIAPVAVVDSGGFVGHVVIPRRRPLFVGGDDLLLEEVLRRGRWRGKVRRLNLKAARDHAA